MSCTISRLIFRVTARARRPLGLLGSVVAALLFAQVLCAQPVVNHALFNLNDPATILRMLESSPSFSVPQPKPAGGPVVSADFLRYPLSPKLARRLEELQRQGAAGKPSQAVRELQAILLKYPQASPYVYNTLGIVQVSAGDFTAASQAFENVLRAMPHVSANYSNLGYALVELGEDDRARQLVHTALVLDDHNEKALKLLGELRGRQMSVDAATAAAH